MKKFLLRLEAWFEFWKALNNGILTRCSEGCDEYGIHRSSSGQFLKNCDRCQGRGWMISYPPRGDR